MKKNTPPKPIKATIIEAADQLRQLNLNAAGIDIGSREHAIAVPSGRDPQPVQIFGTFTEDLEKIALWLKNCKIDTVAMESTGVYWIPLYEILEQHGIECILVNAKHLKNVSGRKTDVLDCQWIQQLHTYGLLSGAFRPDDQTVRLRGYLRHRHMLIQHLSPHILHMQKALMQMNLQLHHVVRDITGTTGINIIRAIVQGERDPNKLAEYRDPRCANSKETIAKSLVGNYREEHLFSLRQALELHDFYRKKIQECDGEIEKFIVSYNNAIEPEKIPAPRSKARAKKQKNGYSFDLHSILHQKFGVDLTAIPGIDSSTALTILSEIGNDLRAWKTVKHFTSWLCLCPGNKVSGGKQLSGKSRPSANRVKRALELVAFGLHKNKNSLGALFRRLKAKLGAPKAITATAHKLARLIYFLVTKGVEYVEIGAKAYEQRYRDRAILSLKRRAKELGFKLTDLQSDIQTT
jgi:transposase